MTLTADMQKDLAKPLDPANVKPPPPGKYGEYIEGWKVIEEANRIFGFDGWTRETVDMVEVCRYETNVGKNQDAGWAVGYRAKVRVCVHGVVREGSAAGNGEARKLYDAVESAIKEAETDAMKRALMTFGYPFGLALYDKTKSNVCAPPVETINDGHRDQIAAIAEAAGVPLQRLCESYGIASLKELPLDKYQHCLNRLNATIEQNKQTENA